MSAIHHHNHKEYHFSSNIKKIENEYALNVRWNAILNGIKNYIKKYKYKKISVEYTDTIYNKNHNWILLTEMGHKVMFEYGYSDTKHDKYFDNLIHNFINVCIIKNLQDATDRFYKLIQDLRIAYNVKFYPIKLKITNLPIFSHLNNFGYDIIKLRPKTMLCHDTIHKRNFSFKFLDCALLIGSIMLTDIRNVVFENMEKIIYELRRDSYGYYHKNNKRLLNELLTKKHLYLHKKVESINCSVCFNDTFYYTNCNHELCKSCYKQLTNKICPLCRKPLDLKITETFENETKEVENYYTEDDEEFEKIKENVILTELVHNDIDYLKDDDYNIFNKHTRELIGTFKNNKINRIIR